MVVSTIQEQRDIIIDAIRSITKGDWKVLVVDAESRKLLDNAVSEDDILNQNITNIEQIEEQRDMNSGTDAIYFLSPQQHIAECLVVDLEVRRYRSAFLLWTGLLDPKSRRMVEGSNSYRSMVSGYDTMMVDFFPRESHLVTFRDPWSFPVLYHPSCNNLVQEHMRQLAQKILGFCVAMGELPKVRYYKPRNPLHEASVLSMYLARFVQEEMDEYANFNPNFPPQTNRPPSTIIITDRSMDLMAPLVHEFTYQAMAHDLLSIDDQEKVTYRMRINEGTRDMEEKDAELSEKDKVWVDNRHRHMKDTIDKLMGDFQKFLDANPHFRDDVDDGSKTNLNAIKDMLAGLPQFTEMKDAYSLHLTMAQECMNRFQARKLPDIASVEQTLATGLDETGRRPKNVLDEVVRLLDDAAITPSDRLRLIIAYILFRGGVIMEDIKRLLAHSDLAGQDGEIITNLELLGARTTHELKDSRPPPVPLFPPAVKSNTRDEEYSLSRFQPVLKTVLDEVCKGTLDQTLFPYVKPPLDPNEDLAASQQGSLRAGRPQWAAAGRKAPENRQRLFVYMAGGATYSESRACYEVSAEKGRDIFLATSHMLTPALFVRQVKDLGVDKRRLDLPMERPKPRVPAYLYDRAASAPPQSVAPPVAPASVSMSSSSSKGRPSRPAGGIPSGPRPGGAPPRPGGAPPRPSGGGLPSRPGGGSSMGMSSTTSAMGSMTLGSRPAPTPSPANGSAYSVPPAAEASGDGRDPREGRPNKLEKKRRNFLGMKK